MIQRILHHFAARVLTAGLSFVMVWLTARYLGAAGRGQVSLFVTDVSALVLFIGLVGGSSLIYLVPRRNVWHLLLPAYAWAGVVSGLGALLLGWWRPCGSAYAWHLGAVTVVQAWFSVNTFLLLGRQRERAYNVLMTVQALLLAGALALAFGPGQWREVPVFYYANYLAYGLPLLISLGQPPRPAPRHGPRAGPPQPWSPFFQHPVVCQLPAGLLRRGLLCQCPRPGHSVRGRGPGRGHLAYPAQHGPHSVRGLGECPRQARADLRSSARQPPHPAGHGRRGAGAGGRAGELARGHFRPGVWSSSAGYLGAGAGHSHQRGWYAGQHLLRRGSPLWCQQPRLAAGAGRDSASLPAAGAPPRPYWCGL